MHYVDREREKATATVQVSESEPIPLLPTDERWDVIVGTITRAVDQAWVERFGRQQ